MMRQLNEQDCHAILSYLYQEPNYNIFPIGDIEHFGFDTDFQQVYATFDQDHHITSMFLRYRENGIFYTDSDAPIDPFLPLITQYDLQYLNMTETLAKRVYPNIPTFIHRSMYFCVYDITKHSSFPSDHTVHRLETRKECEELYELLSQVKEFGIFKQTKERFVEGKLKSMAMGVTLYIKEEGKMVSTVATTAETTKNAMVVAVATLPEYRNQGYASRLMNGLIEEYHTKHKHLCLFYDNPDAGRIYHRLGFEDIGKWAMFERKT